MPYNITTFRVDRIGELQFKIDDLTKNNLCDVRLLQYDMVEVTGDFSALFLIRGKLNDGIVSVDSIGYGDMASGRNWSEFLHLLSKSSGELDVLIIWEDGEQICRMYLCDGEISYGEI